MRGTFALLLQRLRWSCLDVGHPTVGFEGAFVLQHCFGSEINSLRVLFRNFRGLTKGWFSIRVALADVPPERKPERGYIRMFPRNENRNEGTFAGFGGTKTGTRVRSDVPPERKPERGHVRMFPRNENRNEGTCFKTTLLRNRPYVSE